MMCCIIKHRYAVIYKSFIEQSIKHIFIFNKKQIDKMQKILNALTCMLEFKIRNKMSFLSSKNNKKHAIHSLKETILA